MSRSLGSYDYEFDERIEKNGKRWHNLKHEQLKRNRKYKKNSRHSWRRFKANNEGSLVGMLGSK